MTNDSTKIVAIILNLFFPGLGNIIVGQTKFGISCLVLSLLFTVFYFLPLATIFFTGELAAIVLVTTFLLACGAFILDLALVVLSILKVIRN